MTACQCTEPGWCERHGCKKSPHLFQLCQTNQEYFDLWEQGKGPGQGKHGVAPKSKPRGPGDILSKMIGCSGKKWPHYVRMNALGAKCWDHIDELAELLAAFKTNCPEAVKISEAKRLLSACIRQWESTVV